MMASAGLSERNSMVEGSFSVRSCLRNAPPAQDRNLGVVSSSLLHNREVYGRGFPAGKRDCSVGKLHPVNIQRDGVVARQLAYVGRPSPDGGLFPDADLSRGGLHQEQDGQHEQGQGRHRLNGFKSRARRCEEGGATLRP